MFLCYYKNVCSGDFDEPAVGTFGKALRAKKPKRSRAWFCMFLLKDHLLS
jgi:hypothetical protein